MLEAITRLGVLLVLGIVTWLLVLVGRRFVENQRRRVLAAAPPSALTGIEAGEDATEGVSPVRILSFSSPDCHQCKKLQAPALERVLEARGETVTVVKIDATTDQDLVRTYRVLTVPSTVILNTEGKAHAINYGFADTHRLLTQVDEVLTSVS
jgi:thiol-disulfide isomerase/thioredoxin